MLKTLKYLQELGHRSTWIPIQDDTETMNAEKTHPEPFEHHSTFSQHPDLYLNSLRNFCSCYLVCSAVIITAGKGKADDLLYNTKEVITLPYLTQIPHLPQA